MKGQSWCAALPLVDVPRRDQAKRVTLVVPYYENPQFLRRQMLGWWGYAPDLLANLTVIIVDDGSPNHPVADVIGEYIFPWTMRAFRIGVDVRWNWLAARNIGMHHASEGWCLLTDMDHVVSEVALRSVVYGQHDPGVIYGFSRVEHTGAVIAPHPNSWLMTRAMFWTVGGYDETLSGHYGTDGDWRRRCASTAPMEILTNRLVRYEFVEDASTSHYKRKQPEDAAVKAIIARRGKGWKPKVLSVPYAEVPVGEPCPAQP